MDFKDTLIKALGTVQNGTVFKRAQVYDYLIGCGYAERTVLARAFAERPSLKARWLASEAAPIAAGNNVSMM